MRTRNNTSKIVLSALMMCIIMVTIMFIKIPIPFTQGYVHPGDAMIILAVVILGWKYGAAAAAFGAMLGDLMGGFAAWAPWTFCIKGIMAVILGVFLSAAIGKEERSRGVKFGIILAGVILAGVFMTVGYYFAEGIMYGNWVVAALGIPWNIGQYVIGAVLAAVLSEAIYKTPAKTYFTYKISLKNK